MKKVAFPLICVLLLTALYYATNPYWYGDALWYALDIKKTPPRLAEAFHLLWRPAGLHLWELLQFLNLSLDAIDALQLLSSFGGGIAVVAVFYLAKRFGFSPLESLSAGALIGSTHFLLAYGGSGASYPGAVAFSTLAFIPIVRVYNTEWTWREASISSLAMLTGWGCWGVALFLLPALGIAGAWYSHGSLLRRGLRGVLLASLSGLLILSTLVVTYSLAIASPGAPSFIAWWGEASSNGVFGGIGIANIARSALGFIVQFAYLGTLGSSIKSILYNGFSGASLTPHLLSIVAASVTGIVILAGIVLLVKKLRSDAVSAPLLLVATTATLPLAFFAIIWNGSDVERYCLSLPLTSLVLIRGLSSVRSSCLVIPLSLALLNFSTLNLPALQSGGGIVMSLGRDSRAFLPEHSLLVVTGQRLGPTVWVPALYYYGLRVHSISFDVLTRGVDGWDTRLDRAIEESSSRGGKVAILSDLLLEPTPGGIGLEENEYPRPTFKEIADHFARWEEDSRYTVDRFTFRVLHHPDRR